MKRAIASVFVLAYALSFAICLFIPGLLEQNIFSLFASGCIVSIIVLMATAKRKEKE